MFDDVVVWTESEYVAYNIAFLETEFGAEYPDLVTPTAHRPGAVRRRTRRDQEQPTGPSEPRHPVLTVLDTR